MNLPKSENPKFKTLAAHFEKKYQGLVREFEERHSDSLEWIKEKGIDFESLATGARRSAVASAAAGLVLLSTATVPTKEVTGIFRQKEQPDLASKEKIKAERDKAIQIKKILQQLSSPGHLDPKREKELAEKLSQVLGFKVSAELNGRRLNTSYGYIGTESHLTRYPGDTFSTHFDSPQAEALYSRTGMAGGRGAFGYFAPSRQSLTEEEVEMEKYYLVAQTFASPDWGKAGSYEWFRHRKFVVINPSNGQAVVGDLADSGPALSTGKQFGGSPEVMDALGLYPPRARQGVIFMFVDESAGVVPLGPR